MDPQQDTNDARFRNPQSPDPLQNSPQGSGTSDMFEDKKDVPEQDVDIDPDMKLQTYQDDIARGEKEDRVQYEQGDQPADFLGIPEKEVKREFDDMAMDEQEYSPDQRGNTGDSATEDKREDLEDRTEDANDNKGRDADSWM